MEEKHMLAKILIAILGGRGNFTHIKWRRKI